MEPEKRKALIARLSSSEEEERRLAMEALKEGITESDLDWLTRPLSDESWRVRKEGIEGLALLPPTHQLVASLVPLMDPERELTLRNSVVEVLERLGHEVAPLIVDHLEIDQTDVRKFLVDILGNIANPVTIPALLGLLSDPEENIQAAAAEALASIGDPSVCPELLNAMEGGDDWVVYSLLGSLAQLRCRKALPVFFRYLDNQLLSKPALSGIGVMGDLEDGIRLMAKVPSLPRGAVKSVFLAAGSIYRRHVAHDDTDSAAALNVAVSETSNDNILHSLAAQLELSDDMDNRRDIIAALGMIGSEQSLIPILNFVEDDSLAWNVDLALLTIGKKEVHLIEGLLEHSDPLVRQRGARTLLALASVDSLDRLYGLLNDESGHVRKDAAMAIAGLGDSSSIDRLLPVLKDEYSDVAQSAAHALVQLGRKSPADLAQKIAPMLPEAGPSVKTLLIMILTQVQAPDWEGLCLKAAQSTEPSVRAAAVMCLKHSESSQAISTIFNSLTDEDPQVRVQAAVTLEELQHPEALTPLKAAIYDQDPWVRSSAISALSAQPSADPSDFQDLLRDEDLMMQTSALDALGRMAASGSENALQMLSDQFVSGALEMRRSICRLMGRISGPEAFDLLRKAMDDDDPGIRVFAVHALAQRQEPQVPDILRDIGETDPDKQVREAARTVLEGLQ